MNFPSLEFDTAVSQLCDGVISDEDLTQLHALLRDDARAKDEYLWRVALHWKLADLRFDAGLLAGTDREADFCTALPARRPPGFSSRCVKTASAVAAILIVMWMLSGRMNSQHDSSPQQTGHAVVGTFGSVDGCKWVNPATLISAGDAVKVGQFLELSAGTAELLFHSGARLSVVGPTVMETTAPNRVDVRFGEVRLVAETPESRGFTVVTPTSTFVDIGTAFTACVSPDGLSLLNVAEGAVEVVLQGVEKPVRLRTGESFYAEPGERQITTLIEEGDGTPEFRFPTIGPPSDQDYADQSQGNAAVRLLNGELRFRRRGAGGSGPVELLLDGRGQSNSDSPGESVFLEDRSRGDLLIDLGSVVSISRVNTYSWHQHESIDDHRQRARQHFTLYGYSGDQLPAEGETPAQSGWTLIARVHSESFFRVMDPLDRPTQQGTSIMSRRGEIGKFRYLRWQVVGPTFFGEIDVYESPP